MRCLLFNGLEIGPAMNRDRNWFLFVSATRGRIVRGLPEPGLPAQSELLVIGSGRALTQGPSRDSSQDRSQHLGDIQEPAARTGPAMDAQQKKPGPMPHGDLPRRDEVEFVRSIFVVLEAHRLAGEFDRLSIFAAPRMLALLRREMPPRLRPMIAGEYPKDLSGIPETRLPEVLRRELGL